MEKNKTERDVKKTLDRLSISTNSVSNHTFKTIDKISRHLSEIQYEEKQSRLLTSSNKDSENSETQDNSKVKDESNLKTNVSSSKEISTNVNSQNINNKNSKDIQSNLKTNKNENELDNLDNNDKIKNERITKLKTLVSKTSNKIFKFDEHQGNISKATTIISKSGSKVARLGTKVTKTSRELNKMLSSDGTGLEYLQDKVNRNIKNKVSKTIKKRTKKIRNKINKTIGKKLVHVLKIIVVKLLKLLISILSMLAEFIIPISFILIIIIFLTTVFGVGGSEEMIQNYKNYMIEVQQEYDSKVDNFLKNNPDGIAIGVNGEYGRIDWRIPLSILSGTGAYLEFDEYEKKLLDKFKDNDLFEKHQIIEQTIATEDDLGNKIDRKIKVLVITNPTYEDYIEWCKDNFSYINDFFVEKNITSESNVFFTTEQIELIDLLYNSSDFQELLGADFETKTPVYGKNETIANLNSNSYNSKNILATSGFKGQCTWFAHGRALELFNKKMPSGNAQTWLNSAIAMGYETGTQPAVNSIVVLAGRKFGHVAYVEAYDGKSITISEGNIGNPCSNSDLCSAVEYANEHANELVRIRTYSSYQEYRRINKNSGAIIVGFIYLE